MVGTWSKIWSFLTQLINWFAYGGTIPSNSRSVRPQTAGIQLDATSLACVGTRYEFLGVSQLLPPDRAFKFQRWVSHRAVKAKFAVSSLESFALQRFWPLQYLVADYSSGWLATMLTFKGSRVSTQTKVRRKRFTVALMAQLNLNVNLEYSLRSTRLLIFRNPIFVRRILYQWQ